MRQVLDLEVSDPQGQSFSGHARHCGAEETHAQGKTIFLGEMPWGAEVHGLCPGLSPAPVAPADGLPLVDDSLRAGSEP